jgi:hypothetical protein
MLSIWEVISGAAQPSCSTDTASDGMTQAEHKKQA